MNDEGLADASAANPFRLPRLQLDPMPVVMGPPSAIRCSPKPDMICATSLPKGMVA